MTESNTKETHRAGVDGNQTDGSNEEIKQSEVRQDAFVVFSNEKDLRHHEAIRIKASLYTGIALRVKIISPGAMENLLYAIDIDSGSVARSKKEKLEKEKKEENKNAVVPATQTVAPVANLNTANIPRQGIINLRFEESKFTRKAAALLSEWLKHKAVIETICFLKVTFEDVLDFKKITEGMKLNQKLLKVAFQQMNFDEEVHGTSIGRVLSDSRSIRELDVTHIVFDYRTFYDMCQAILNERCRLNVLKMRGILIGEIEGKIIQFILMKNKQIHTLDLSECRTEEPANFEYFFEKLNQFCHIKFLTLEKMQPDLSLNIETIGEALADNTKLEVLILRDNKLKWVPYQNFWTSVQTNKTLQKINLQKTDLNDRVVEKMCKYLEQDDIALADLDLSKNQVTDAGLKFLSQSLMKNKSIMFLNLGQNKLKDEGFPEFVELLKVNTTLQEISLGGNIISNEGIICLADFLEFNKTVCHLDLSRNSFNDTGFEVFAEALAYNEGISFLDIAKNKEVTDEGSLIYLCDALTVNKKLQTLDLTGLSVRKPFLKQNFDQALKRNITLQNVIGKIPSNIIQPELEQNVIIEKEILPLYQPTFKAGKEMFNLGLVEDNPENHSRLNLREQPQRLLKAAFKLIRNYDIRSVDFTSSGIHDDSLRMLSLYLRSNPNLRSIVLDKNLFTDDGLNKLTKELEKNTKLAHLSIKGCTNVTDVGLQRLCDVISTTNTCLFQVDLDVDQFDQELAMTVITESALNRDIQEKLKPVKITTILSATGEVLKVTYGSDRLEVELDSSETESEDEKEVLVAPADQQERSRTSLHSQGQTDTTEASIKPQMFKKNSERSAIKGSNSQQLQIDEPQTRCVIEVKFDENAKVGECFESALKAWRINQPNVIRAEDQLLSDDHIQKLCDFLSDRQMITHLNLRRNMISSAGAKCLGNFIQECDETLTHLDITRNRIGQDGGQAIFDALNATTRIVDCQIKYGNPISNKMGRIIEREIKANIQAVSYATQNKEHEALKYELIDKGPDFMRCAIKMAQLHDILHLSLPDNMLALEDARMIADLIKRDTPLRKLNLSTNQLDADCAALIANSLIYNKNLQLLDLSKNLLGDLGVYLLLTPLVRKHLQDMNVVSKATPIIREKVLAQGKDVKASKRLFKNVPILTQLKYLGLEDNKTTSEVYKQVWLLLVTDQDISIKIEDPETMKDRDSMSLFDSQISRPQIKADTANSSQSPRKDAPVSSKQVAPDNSNDESKTQLLEAGMTPGSSEQIVKQEQTNSEATDQEKSEEELDEEALLEQERKAIEAERQRRLEEKREKALMRKRKKIVCCQKFCCFKDEDQEFDLDQKMPSLTQVMCWRFLRSRKQANKFYTSQETLHALEKSSFTACVSLLISFNYLVLYAVVIVPFVLIILQDQIETIEIDGVEYTCDEQQAACDDREEQDRIDFNNFVLMINAGVLFYSMFCEAIIVGMMLKPTNTKCNSYLVCQILTGLTMRAIILISAQVIAVFVQEVNIVEFTLGCILASTLVLSQIRAFQIWLVSIKKDKNNLLPKVQQNLQICMSTNYLACATVFSKVNVEASNSAIQQTKALEAERARLMSFSGFADEDAGKGKKKRSEMKAKLANKCKCCRWTSPKFYQLIMNDIPLIFCLPFAYVFGLFDTVNAAVGVALTLLDLGFMLFYLSYDEQFCIDSESVYSLSVNRLSSNEVVITKMLSDQISVQDVDMESEEEASKEQRHSEQNSNPEQEVLLTDNQNEAGSPRNGNQTDTIAYDSMGGQALAGNYDPAKAQTEQQDDLVVNENSSRKVVGSLPPLTSDTQVDRSKKQSPRPQ